MQTDWVKEAKEPTEKNFSSSLSFLQIAQQNLKHLKMTSKLLGIMYLGFLIAWEWEPSATQFCY